MSLDQSFLETLHNHSVDVRPRRGRKYRSRIRHPVAQRFASVGPGP